MEGRSTIVIGEGLCRVVDWDEIVVLEDGDVSGRGRDGELMRNDRVYREVGEKEVEVMKYGDSDNLGKGYWDGKGGFGNGEGLM
ncbi:hypothetical protein [Paenibacillus xylanexedens]|uniref:hypothetical protein n=1 Tax=Paenibacillus xylanexedens TaxID=528191 RepID=UPI00119E5BD0|nr:hypothetical protein [Paenibacillus xylanexedens]